MANSAATAALTRAAAVASRRSPVGGGAGADGDRVLGAATRRPAWQAWRAPRTKLSQARRHLLFFTPSHETRREMRRRAPLVPAVQVLHGRSLTVTLV